MGGRGSAEGDAEVLSQPHVYDSGHDTADITQQYHPQVVLLLLAADSIQCAGK